MESEFTVQIVDKNLRFISYFFPRAVKYHRALGVLFWIFATLHMLIYQVKWLQKGTLATNAWQNVSNIPRKNIDLRKMIPHLFPLISGPLLTIYGSCLLYFCFSRPSIIYFLFLTFFLSQLFSLFCVFIFSFAP